MPFPIKIWLVEIFTRAWPGSSLVYNKADFTAFEASVQLQIEVKQKMLGRSVTFGPKSVEKHFQQQNFFELTTPSQQVTIFLDFHAEQGLHR